MTDRLSDSMSIRMAAPADAVAFADLAMMASDPMYPLLFGGGTHRILQHMCRQTRTLWSHDKAYFAVVREQTAGMIQGFDYLQQQAEHLHTVWAFLRLIKCRLPSVLLDSLFIPRWCSKARPGEYYVLHLAVYPGFRRRGIADSLLRHAETIACERGCEAISLDVNSSDPVPLSLYKKTGYRLEKEAPIRLLRHKLGTICRLRKAL
jgi:ribosomal protein S18 acetylase RimI-like enzyme